MSDSRLLLIDGHSLAFRAFYAMPADSFMTSSGQHTNAVYGFVSMLTKLLQEVAPTHLCVAFDLSHYTFRTSEYADYKGTREKTPEEFKGQIELIKELLDAVNISHLGVENYEADDIIASLARTGSEAGLKIDICSGDRDAIQLVNQNVTLLFPRRGISEMDVFDPDAVKEKYSVTPAQYPQLAALVGETSDNLPGVPGVGPKTAAKWINQYGSLENILAAADTIKGKVGESLRAHISEVKRNRRLNRLVDDLAIPIRISDLQLKSPDLALANELLDTLQIGNLRHRFFEVLPGGEVQEAETVEVEIKPVDLASGELSNWIETHAGQQFGVDFVGRWAAGEGDIYQVSVSAADGQTIFIDVVNQSVNDSKEFAKWLADPQVKKSVHDAKGPILACWSRGWQIDGITCDPQLGAYLMSPDQRDYSLERLSRQYLGRDLAPSDSDDNNSPEQNQLELDFGDNLAETRVASASRAIASRDLAEVFDQSFSTAEHNLLTDVELPLQLLLAKMEQTGIAVDQDCLQRLRDDFDVQVLTAQQDAYDVLGHEINLSSPKQLQVALFDELDLPKTRKIKSGYTTAAPALVSLYEQTSHPFLAALLTHRDQIKLRQIVDGLLKAIGDDGRIHTTFMQIAAATGRLSSVDPNLQTIPFRTESGRRIRYGFIAGAGYENLMSADYSQIEMRVMAHSSQDEGLIAAFESGEDFHTEMAARVFDIPATQINVEQRSRIKAMNYGLAYGLSAYGLSKQLGVGVPEAKELMKVYFSRFGKVQNYLHSLVEQARQTGYTETILGRRRYLPDLTSPNRQLREIAERAALNAPIQGSAADIMKVAMLNVANEFSKAGLKSRILLQVHDELIIELAAGEESEVRQIVSTQMSSALDLDVPLDVSIGVGRTWQDAQHN